MNINNNLALQHNTIQQTISVDLDITNNEKIQNELLKKGEIELDRRQKFIDQYNEQLIELQKIDTQKLQIETQKQEFENFAYNMTSSYLSIINWYGVVIWKDYDTNSLYYRLNLYGQRKKVNIANFVLNIHAITGIDFNVYKDVIDIENTNKGFIVTKWIKPIKDDVFYPYSNQEFITINNINYRNTFQYSQWLQNRFTFSELQNNEQQIQNFKNQIQILSNNNPYMPQPFTIDNPQTRDIQIQIDQLIQRNQYLTTSRQKGSSIIKDFIYSLCDDIYQCEYIFNLLAFIVQTFCKSNALVLIGDNDTTNILINQIIKPIFAFKEDDFCSIDDKWLERTDDYILKDKVFYHIDELSPSNIKDKSTNKLVRELLKINSTTHDTAIEYNKSFIFGQLIIASSKDTPYPFISDCYNNCTVLKVKHLDSILKKLNTLHLDLDQNIQLDLDNFTKILSQHTIDYSKLSVLNTDEKIALPQMKKGILLTPKIEQQIMQFISAIKEKNSEYFKPLELEEDKDLYEELVVNFEDDAVYQPKLSEYFNILHGDIIFQDNADFIEILKDRECLFNQVPDDKFKLNGLRRYKIYKYKLSPGYKGNCENTDI